MFSCKESVNVLMDFLDGDMSAEDRSRLQQHLAACPPCVDFLKTYNVTPGLCKRALAKQMPSELSERLTEFLRAKIKSAS